MRRRLATLLLSVVALATTSSALVVRRAPSSSIQQPRPPAATSPLSMMTTTSPLSTTKAAAIAPGPAHAPTTPPRPPMDLSSPHVRVSVRPATTEELPLIVDMRLAVFCPMEGATEWKGKSMENMQARRDKGAIVLVATAQDLRRPEARPVLIGSVEMSSHEFAEVGFSPCLAEQEGEEEEEVVRGGYFDYLDEEEEGAYGYSLSSSSWGSRSRSSSSSSSSSASKKKLYVTGVMVLPAYRRQGVAASLLQAVDAHAAAQGISYTCMYVEATNTAALTLYQRQGYHLVAYSAQAEAFASAIGLYKGPFAARQYSFAYKRLSASAPVKKEEEEKEEEHYNPSKLSVPVWWFSEEGGGKQGKGKSLLQEPGKPFPARTPALFISPY